MAIFTDTIPTADIATYHAACDLFETTYGHNISDVIFGTSESDWDDAELVADAKLLDSWDCWLFVADVCPNYADYGDFCANGGYDDPATDKSIMDHIGSGNAGFAMDHATVGPVESIIKKIGSID
jgi:hypothetical protein